MTNRVTFAQLERILLDVGFTKKVLPGKGVVFHHAPSETPFPVRAYKPNEKVPDYLLAAARGQLDGRGILDAKDFDERLNAVAA
jgi:hypothetical protein